MSDLAWTHQLKNRSPISNHGTLVHAEWNGIIWPTPVLNSRDLATTSFGDCMPRLFVTLLLLSTFASAQQANSAGPAATQPPRDLPVWSTQLTQPNRYISAHGLRGFAGGYSEDGLEFWSFPLQIVSGYQLRFALPQVPAVSAISMLTSVAAFDRDTSSAPHRKTAPDRNSSSRPWTAPPGS